jgi:hypothetical protein
MTSAWAKWSGSGFESNILSGWHVSGSAVISLGPDRCSARTLLRVETEEEGASDMDEVQGRLSLAVRAVR